MLCRALFSLSSYISKDVCSFHHICHASSWASREERMINLRAVSREPLQIRTENWRHLHWHTFICSTRGSTQVYENDVIFVIQLDLAEIFAVTRKHQHFNTNFVLKSYLPIKNKFGRNNSAEDSRHHIVRICRPIRRPSKDRYGHKKKRSGTFNKYQVVTRTSGIPAMSCRILRISPLKNGCRVWTASAHKMKSWHFLWKAMLYKTRLFIKWYRYIN